MLDDIDIEKEDDQIGLMPELSPQADPEDYFLCSRIKEQCFSSIHLPITVSTYLSEFHGYKCFYKCMREK